MEYTADFDSTPNGSSYPYGNLHIPMTDSELFFSEGSQHYAHPHHPTTTQAAESSKWQLKQSKEI